jgi:hypothetical protein
MSRPFHHRVAFHRSDTLADGANGVKNGVSARCCHAEQSEASGPRMGHRLLSCSTQRSFAALQTRNILFFWQEFLVAAKGRPKLRMTKVGRGKKFRNFS